MTLLRFFPYLVGLALAVSACGGGGGGAAPGGGGPTPCPAGFTGVAPACNPITASGSIALGTTASTAALPSAGGYSASVQLPSASPSTTASVTTSTQTPTGITALSSTLRRPLAVNSPLLYFTFVPAATVTLNGIPGFTITLPSSVSPSQSFYLAFYQNGLWQTFAGPGSIAGQTVTFAPAAGSIVLTANQPLYFAFYAGAVLPTPTPTATPTPTPTPTATPTPPQTSAFVYVSDSSDVLPRIQQFAMTGGLAQGPQQVGGGGRDLYSAAVAPDGTFYTGKHVNAFARDLTFLRQFAPNTTPTSLATDGGGNVYDSTAANISVYPPGATDPTPPLRVMNVAGTTIFVDALGEVISLGSSTISVYPPKSSGAVTPTRTITPASGITFSGGVSADSANNIYVTGKLFTQNAIFVYPPTAQGAASPSRTISGPTANVGTPLIAVDATGFIYVCCSQGLQSFAPTATGDARQVGAASLFSGSHTNFTGMAVDPNAVTNAGPP